MDWGNVAGWAMVILTVAGFMIGGFKQMSSRASAIERQCAADRTAAELQRVVDLKEMHTRINEVKDKYVRRDDLKEHLDRVERGQSQMKTEIVTELQKLGATVNDMQIKVARAINGHGGGQ